MHFDQNDKFTIRFREQNIHNSAYAIFDGTGNYDIPNLLPNDDIDEEDLRLTPFQGFNFAIKEQHPENIGVHFFLHDYQFERIWNYPDRYLDVLARFPYVLSPDFSPYGNLPKATRIFNIYRKNWCARYWQEYGINVIPTITWGDESDFEFCFDGIPKHSTIAISTMGEGRWGKYRLLKYGWQYMLDAIEPNLILLYGKDLRSELSGNIIYKPMMSRKVNKSDGKDE